MQINELDQSTLRRLTDARPEKGKVLSIYLDLDPTEFATPAARSTEIRSLLDEAGRRVKNAEGLSHDELAALRGDLKQLREFLEGGGFSAKGAHALAVFSSQAGGLFEVIRLPRSVPSQVALNDAPFVEPMAELATPVRWAVLLVNRRAARLFRGSGDRLQEVEGFAEDRRGGRTQASGTQARGQGAVDEESHYHMTDTVEALRSRTKRVPVERLVIGCPRDLYPQMERALPPDLRERLAGHIEVDVEHSNAEDVLRSTAPLIEEDERRREREALDALEEGVGRGGRGAAGLDEVLGVLNERRVQTLLLDEGFAASGVVCRTCGWIGVSGDTCPADGGPLEQLEDVVEAAIERTIQQAADVLVVHRHDDLSRHGSIGAVLRF